MHLERHILRITTRGAKRTIHFSISHQRTDSEHFFKKMKQPYTDTKIPSLTVKTVDLDMLQN
jgi:hypothetical protein